MKLSDKIAYVGRDIEDALNLGFLSPAKVGKLQKIVGLKNGEAVNTSTIMSNMILDVCRVSTIEKGICFSEEMGETLTKIKAFNNENIYKNKRFSAFNRYADLVISELFSTLYSCYDRGDPVRGLEKKKQAYPTLVKEFCDYLFKYCNDEFSRAAGWKKQAFYKNAKPYGALETKEIYARAVLDYIAGMTDRFAVKCFDELITY